MTLVEKDKDLIWHPYTQMKSANNSIPIVRGEGAYFYDEKGKKYIDAIKESKRITQGYKEEIFVLGLSFIGWGLLCILSIGIGFIWLIPYIKITYSNLYNKLSSTPEIVDNGDFVPTV